MEHLIQNSNDHISCLFKIEALVQVINKYFDAPFGYEHFKTNFKYTLRHIYAYKIPRQGSMIDLC